MQLGEIGPAIFQSGCRREGAKHLPSQAFVFLRGATCGLALDRGVLVNSRLQTSDPDIFAAGDIARWPDSHTGESIRVEHWVVAERQGQVAAANMLGDDQPFVMVPFFWTKHFDLSIRYVGHAEKLDETLVEGDLAHRNGLVRFRRAGRDLAVATVERDKDSLRAELAMEGESQRSS
jgi:NADPH-dependent 2,4-dienoyl-CoA reductase/sulfur reductase-like enzyme